MWHTKDVDILMFISPLANPNYHLVLTPLIIYSSLKLNMLKTTPISPTTFLS